MKIFREGKRGEERLSIRGLTAPSAALLLLPLLLTPPQTRQGWASSSPRAAFHPATHWGQAALWDAIWSGCSSANPFHRAPGQSNVQRRFSLALNSRIRNKTGSMIWVVITFSYILCSLTKFFSWEVGWENSLI